LCFIISSDLKIAINNLCVSVPLWFNFHPFREQVRTVNIIHVNFVVLVFFVVKIKYRYNPDKIISPAEKAHDQSKDLDGVLSG